MWLAWPFAIAQNIFEMFYPYNENMDIICITQYNLYRTPFTYKKKHFQRPTTYLFFILTFFNHLSNSISLLFLKKIYESHTKTPKIGQFDGICCIRSSLRLPAKDMELFKILDPLDWLYLSLLSTRSWCVVSALAPLSCGSHQKSSKWMLHTGGGWGETPPPTWL